MFEHNYSIISCQKLSSLIPPPTPICAQEDFNHHVDYIHYNPVHHGLVLSPKDWQYSSFHRYVQRGIYDVDWGVSQIPIFDSWVGME